MSPSGSGWCSNTTRTGMPIVIASRSQLTRFVVSRSDGCSTISMIATTYGNSGPGIHGWWLIENDVSVARPDTASTARSFARHRGQMGCGGWTYSPQSWQRHNRSSPCAPPVQNSRLTSSRRGRIRNGGSGAASLVPPAPVEVAVTGSFLLRVFLRGARGFEAFARVRDRFDGRQQTEPGCREHDRTQDLFPRRTDFVREARMPAHAGGIAQRDRHDHANELVRLAVGRVERVDLRHPRVLRGLQVREYLVQVFPRGVAPSERPFVHAARR